MDTSAPDKKYESSRDRYAELGIDTDSAVEALGRISLSLHCLPGEAPGGDVSPSGRPGRARTVHDLRQDLHRVFSLVPGRHRVLLHSIYGEFEQEPVERNAYEPSHYRGWIEWAKQEGLKLDFSATCFAHPQAASGYTLSSRDKDVRRFWIDHVKRCRKISAYMGREMKTAPPASTASDSRTVPLRFPSTAGRTGPTCANPWTRSSKPSIARRR